MACHGKDGDIPGRPAALDVGKTVLGWHTTDAMRGRRFSKVVLMGPYWSGTNAIREEVIWRFFAPVLNPDKLEVCAPDADAARSLREGLARGPVLADGLQVGQRCVPKGYRLLGGPSSRGLLSSLSSSRGARARQARSSGAPDQSDLPQISEESQVANDGIAMDQLDSLKPPVTLSFGPDTGGSCGWWKHAVRRQRHGEIDTDDDTLVVLVTKDPTFWLKSMSKYIYPEIKIPPGCQRSGMEPLFGELSMEGWHYRDAVELWNNSMCSFLDEGLYPSSRCIILRYEDFLFRFWDVMVHLAAFLPANGQRLKEPPNASRSKTHGRVVRGREEALRFYALHKNKYSDFLDETLERIAAGFETRSLRALGYESPLASRAEVEVLQVERGLCPWVPMLKPGDIVATRFRCDGIGANSKDALGEEEEALSSGRRAYALVVENCNEKGSVTIQLLREVPRCWVANNQQDWSVVEWPPEKSQSDPLRHVQVFEQTVPREWVDLRLPTPSRLVSTGGGGAALPVTEEGYRAAVGLRNTGEMADFITRVVGELEVNGIRGGRILNQQRLLGFARWFSGEANVQSLDQIQRELPTKEIEQWVTFAPPRPTRNLEAPGKPPPPPPTRSLGTDLLVGSPS